MNLQFPTIEPVTNGINRPFWSVMIPTYNGKKYLEQTLESVLVQAPEPDEMQIEVVDDCSTENDLEALVKEIGQGRVAFYRNPQNLGLLKNWDTCIRRARGQWIHLLHQDDLILPRFYEQLRKGIDQEPNVGAALCRYVYIDEDGHWQSLSALEEKSSGLLSNWLEKIAIVQRVQFPAIVVKRSTYEKLGGFCPQARSAADWEMWKRISTHYPIWYEPKILACFRLHSGSTTSGLTQRGENIADTYKAIDVSETYLPKATASSLSKRARKTYATFALETAQTMLSKDELSGAFAQFREGIKFSRSPRSIKSATLIALKLARKWLSQKVLKGNYVGINQ